MSLSEFWSTPGSTAKASPAPVALQGIELRSVGKYFGSGRHRQQVLQDVTFSVQAGEFVSIIGRSGCGKSTLLRLIGGLLPLSSGEVSVNGQSTDRRPPPQVRYVFQDYAQSLFSWKSVADNIRFGQGQARQKGTGSAADSPQDFLRLVELADIGHRYPAELSGGMQQRVAIARALASRPDYLLMDEPFSAVDALSRARLQDATQRLRHQLGLTVVLVTHDIEEAIYLSDRVLVLMPQVKGIAYEIPITLPEPRTQAATRESAAFLAYRRQLMNLVLELS